MTHGGPRTPGPGKRLGRPPIYPPMPALAGPFRLTESEAAQLRARCRERNVSVQEATRAAWRAAGLID